MKFRTIILIMLWWASCYYFYTIGYLRGGTAANIEVLKYFK